MCLNLNLLKTMNSNTFYSQLEQAQPLLEAFLEKPLGGPAPLTLQPPEAVPQQAAEQATARGHLVHFATSTGTQAIVVLDTAWVEALAANVLNEEAGNDTEWLGTIAEKGYETLRSQLADTIALPDASVQVRSPASVSDYLTEPVYRLPFHLESSFQALDGFVLLSGAPEPAPAVAPVPAGAPTTLQPAPAMSDTENTIAPAAFPDLGRETLTGDGSPGNLDLLADVELEVTVELGRRRLPLADVLRLSTGSVIELEKVVGEPLEVYANGRLIAEGEAVVIDEHFGIRITRLASGR